MGFFSRDFETPGPGVPDNMPRLTGFRRLWEVFSRDGWTIFKAGLIAVISFLPAYLTMSIAVQVHSTLFMVAAGVIGGMLAAPQMTGIADTVLRALRDEPVGLTWWSTYKDAWKVNWKASLLPGALIGLVHASQVFVLFHMTTMLGSAFSLVALLLGSLLALGVFTFVWPQIALFDLKLGGLLKNSLLLFFRFAGRGFGAAVIQAVYWSVFLLFYPMTPVIMLPLTGLWLPLFLSLFVVYKPLEEAFNIEEEIKKLQNGGDAEEDSGQGE